MICVGAKVTSQNRFFECYQQFARFGLLPISKTRTFLLPQIVGCCAFDGIFIRVKRTANQNRLVKEQSSANYLQSGVIAQC